MKQTPLISFGIAPWVSLDLVVVVFGVVSVVQFFVGVVGVG